MEFNLKRHLDDLNQVKDDGAIIDRMVDDVEDELRFIKVEEKFKFLVWIDIGNDKEAMILEHRETRQIRFFSPTMGDGGKIHFVQLGLQ